MLVFKCFIVVLLFCLLLAVQMPISIFPPCECFPKTFEAVPIFIIHQSDKRERRIRFEKYLQQFFPQNPHEFVEPLSCSFLSTNLDKFYGKNYLSKQAYESLKNDDTVHKGSLTLSAFSLALTNFRIYQTAIQRRFPVFLILEDDFIPCETFQDEMQKAWKHLETIDWDMVYLSCHSASYFERIQGSATKSLVPVHHMLHGMGAVLYTNHAAHVLQKNLLPLQRQIDHDIPDRFIVPSLLKAYMLFQENGAKLIHNDNYYYASTTQLTEREVSKKESNKNQ